MKAALITLTAAGILAASGSAFAQEDLAKSAGCTAKCHAVDAKKKGPAFKATAAKYKGKPDAEAAVTASFKKEHDPADVKVSDGDLNKLVKWILTL
jgi:cytochrome c